MKRRHWLTVVIACTAAAPVGAARAERGDTQGPVERDVERGAAKAERGAKRAAEKTERGAEGAGERLGEGADRAADKIGKTAERAGNRIEKETSVAAGELSDTVITAKIKAAYVGEDLLEGSDVSVDTEDGGEVTLSGSVRSEAARRRALEIARRTNGVVRVTDALKVKGARR
jgi:osmotically-inducible protein OsmY